jgi:hypothetical protein
MISLPAEKKKKQNSQQAHDQQKNNPDRKNETDQFWYLYP